MVAAAPGREPSHDDLEFAARCRDDSASAARCLAEIRAAAGRLRRIGGEFSDALRAVREGYEEGARPS